MKILNAVVQFVIRPLRRMTAMFLATIPDARIRLLPALLAALLTAGVFSFSESMAQESASQEAPPVSVGCVMDIERDWVCNLRCRTPDGAVYGPIDSNGETVPFVGRRCANSNPRQSCEALRDCLDSRLYQTTPTEEWCVAVRGLSSSDTCGEIGLSECAAEALKATQARCEPPAVCEPPLVGGGVSGGCFCPWATHLEVDGECIPHDLLPRATVSFLPGQNGRIAFAEHGNNVQVGDGGSVPRGLRVFFQAEPDVGYYLSRWKGVCEGTEVLKGNINAERYGNFAHCGVTVTVANNVTVGAEFSRVRNVNVSWSPRDGGTVQVVGDLVNSRVVGDILVGYSWRHEAGDGAAVTLRAVPGARHYVSGWAHPDCAETGDAANPGEVKQCALTADADLTAAVTFAALPPRPPPLLSEYAVHYARVPANGFGGTLTVAGLASGAAAARGSMVTFAASPAEGFYVYAWSAPGCAETGDAANPRVVRRCALAADSELFVTVVFAETFAPRWRCLRPLFGIREGLDCDALCPHPRGDYPATANGGYMFDFYNCQEGGASECEAEARERVGAVCVPPERITSPRAAGALPFDPPARPENVFWTWGSENSGSVPGWVHLYWTIPVVSTHSGVRISGYEIVREINGSGNFVSVGFDPYLPYEGIYGDNPPPGSTVRYRVRAHSNAGPGAFSEASDPAIIPASFQPYAPPGTPVAELQPNKSAFIRWTPPGRDRLAISAYHVLREIDGSENLMTAAVVSAGPAEGFSYVDYSSPGGVTVRYRVRAEGESGLGPVSEASNPLSIPPEVRFAHIPFDGRGGSLTAQGVRGDNELVDWGATITFTATPTGDYYVSDWGNSECENVGVAEDAGAEKECVLHANANVYATVTFSPSSPESAMWAVSFDAGSLFAMESGATVESGDLVSGGATVTFTALIPSGYEVSLWTNNGATVLECGSALSCAISATMDLNAAVLFRRDCARLNRAAVSNPQECGDCLAFDLEGTRTDFMALERDGLCLHWADFGGASQADVCLALRRAGDRILEGEGRVCSGVDENDTFCILDSADAFPCGGFFKHVLRCNLKYARPAMNPFFCGVKCGENKSAAGADCR